MISLRDEIDFLEVYLSMQDRRYSDRVKRNISVDPELHDALIPAMILQPIVENAYVHGLSKIERDGDLLIEARKLHNNVVVTITNSGVGLVNGRRKAPKVMGLGSPTSAVAFNSTMGRTVPSRCSSLTALMSG